MVLTRLVIATSLALLGCTGSATSASYSTAAGVPSYAGQVLLPSMTTDLGSIMRLPFEILRFSQRAVGLGFLNVSSTEDVRERFYNQVVELGVGDTSRSSISMIYGGFEDGSFVGYFSPESYTLRGAGLGRASSIPWAPYTLATVNAICSASSACQGPTGKVVNETCVPGGRDTSNACRSLNSVVVGDNATSCFAQASTNVWYAPCTTTCCDSSIRAYYNTSIDVAGKPIALTRWRDYDPRVRTWYIESKRAHQQSNISSLYSSMYEFATTMSLGLTATVTAAYNHQFLGVFAIDYEVGALSSIVNASVEAKAGAWGFVVERDTGKLVAVSSGDMLYNMQSMTTGGLSFVESRLSAVHASHPSIAMAARFLSAHGWPVAYNKSYTDNTTSTGMEYQTASLTDAGLNWLVVAGTDISCQNNQVWESTLGSCYACPASMQPAGGECVNCPPGHAGSNGKCHRCPDGKQPNIESTSCVSCGENRVTTNGAPCEPCEHGKQPNHAQSKCECKPGMYNRKNGLISCFDREFTAEKFRPDHVTNLQQGFECITCPSCVECPGQGAPPTIKSGYSLSPVGTRVWTEGLQTNTSRLLHTSALLLAAVDDLAPVSHGLHQFTTEFPRQMDIRVRTCLERKCTGLAHFQSFRDGYCDFDAAVDSCVAAKHAMSLNISLFKCPVYSGGGSACASVDLPVRDNETTRILVDGDESVAKDAIFTVNNSQCSVNHDGALCGQCVSSESVRFKGGFKEACQKCSDETLKIVLTCVALVLIVCVALLVYRWLAKQAASLDSIKTRYLVMSKVWQARSTLGMGSDNTKVQQDNTRAPLMDTFRILVGNFQIIRTLPMTFRATFINYLPFASALFDAMAWFDLDMIGLVGVDCLVPYNLYGKFFSTILTPMLVVTIIQVRHRLKWLGKKRKLGERGGVSRTHSFKTIWSAKKVAKTIKSKLRSDQGTAANQQCMLVIFFFYPPYDHSIDCNSAEYQAVRVLTMVSLVLFPVGIPVFFGVLMYWNKERLAVSNDNEIEFPAFIEICRGMLKGEMEEETLKEIFDDVDTDGSGSVNPNEIYAYAFRSELSRRLREKNILPVTDEELDHDENASSATAIAFPPSLEEVEELVMNQHDEWRTVHVNHIPSDHANEAALTHLFSKFGKVVCVTVRRKRVPSSAGFRWALVTFNNMKAVETLTQNNPEDIVVKLVPTMTDDGRSAAQATRHVLKVSPLDYEKLCGSSAAAQALWAKQRQSSAEKTKKKWWYGGKQDFSFLCKTYHPQYYYFELTIFLKKFVLAGVLVFAEPGSITQLYLGLFISFWFLSILVHTMPYKKKKTMTVALVAEVNLFFTILFVLMLKLDLHGEWLSQDFFDLNLICFNCITACLPCLLGLFYAVLKFSRLWTDSKDLVRKGDQVEILTMADRQLFETNVGTIVSEVPINCTEDTKLEIELPSKIRKHPWKMTQEKLLLSKVGLKSNTKMDDGFAAEAISEPESVQPAANAANLKRTACCWRRNQSTADTVPPHMVTVVKTRYQVRRIVSRGQFYREFCKLIVHTCRLGRAIVGIDVEETDVESQEKGLTRTKSVTFDSANMTSDAATAKAMVKSLKPVLEQRLADRFGLHWSTVEPEIIKMFNSNQLQAALDDPEALIADLLANPIIRRAIIQGLKPVLESIMVPYGLTWNIAYLALDAAMNNFDRIEAIMAEPETVFQNMLEKGGPVCIVLIGMLQPKLEILCENDNLTWVVVAGALESLATVEMLLAALETPDNFFASMQPKLAALAGPKQPVSDATQQETSKEKEAAAKQQPAVTSQSSKQVIAKPPAPTDILPSPRQQLMSSTSSTAATLSTTLDGKLKANTRRKQLSPLPGAPQ